MTKNMCTSIVVLLDILIQCRRDCQNLYEHTFPLVHRTSRCIDTSNSASKNGVKTLSQPFPSSVIPNKNMLTSVEHGAVGVVVPVEIVWHDGRSDVYLLFPAAAASSRSLPQATFLQLLRRHDVYYLFPATPEFQGTLNTTSLLCDERLPTTTTAVVVRSVFFCNEEPRFMEWRIWGGFEKINIVRLFFHVQSPPS